jgi:hypothetical protein
MSCKTKARLAMEYEAATTRFSQAVKELRHKIGTTSEEYERLSRGLQ